MQLACDRIDLNDKPCKFQFAISKAMFAALLLDREYRQSKQFVQD